MLQLSSVTKTYGVQSTKVEALRSIDMRIEAGEFVSIVGPSGSGKSTLLQLIGALDAPSSGSIEIAGQDITKLCDDDLTVFRRHTIGFVFQFFNLLPTLHALDNVLLPVRLERPPTAADHLRAQELLARVELADRAQYQVHQLSGGQMQRIAIARALMLEPRVILADEPTGNLDSTTGGAILRLLREVCLGTGTTVVMVTHNREAAAIADRIISMRDGLIVQDEPVRRALEGAAE